jgi:hypothetical protein
VQLVSQNSTIKRIVNPENIRSFQGLITDTAEFSAGSAPGIRFTPAHGEEQWFTPSGFKGILIIRVEMLTLGVSADDAFNLWWAVKRALYPPTPSPWPPITAYSFTALGVQVHWTPPFNASTNPYPPTPCMTVSGALQKLGMHTSPMFGQLVFHEPIMSTMIKTSAMLKCEVREDLNL